MNKYKIGDIVVSKPFGECPLHYCKIESFKTWDNDLITFAMGDWYSIFGNCVKGTGFDVNYIETADEKDLFEAKRIFKLKNDNNDAWYNFFGDYPLGNIQGFELELNRLNNDGPHPWDCKCILHV